MASKVELDKRIRKEISRLDYRIQYLKLILTKKVDWIASRADGLEIRLNLNPVTSGHIISYGMDFDVSKLKFSYYEREYTELPAMLRDLKQHKKKCQRELQELRGLL